MRAAETVLGASLAFVLLGYACCTLLGCKPVPAGVYEPLGPPRAAPARRYTAHEANKMAARQCRGRSLDVVRCYLKIHQQITEPSN